MSEINKSIGKRSGIDFSNHNLKILKSDDLLIHYLKKPDTICDSIKYINTQGIMAITGDYSNWIFCREFHPSENGMSSEQYWIEKLKISSCQEPAKYDSERTHSYIKEILADPDRDLDDNAKEYLENLLTLTDDELEYTYKAYREMPGKWDYEDIPYIKSINFHFLAILDGFDEICRRIRDKEETISL